MGLKSSKKVHGFGMLPTCLCLLKQLIHWALKKFRVGRWSQGTWIGQCHCEYSFIFFLPFSCNSRYMIVSRVEGDSQSKLQLLAVQQHYWNRIPQLRLVSCMNKNELVIYLYEDWANFEPFWTFNPNVSSKQIYKLESGICMAPIVPPSTLRITPVHHEPARLAK